MSWSQNSQANALGAFSFKQKGHIISASSWLNLQDKASSAGAPVRILDIDPNHVLALRKFYIRNIDPRRLDEGLDAIGQINVRRSQVSHFDRLQIDLGSAERYK